MHMQLGKSHKSATKYSRQWCGRAQCCWEMHTILPQPWGKRLHNQLGKTGCPFGWLCTVLPCTVTVIWVRLCTWMLGNAHKPATGWACSPLHKMLGSAQLNVTASGYHHSANMLGRPQRLHCIWFAFGCTLSFRSSPRTGQAQERCKAVKHTSRQWTSLGMTFR